MESFKRNCYGLFIFSHVILNMCGIVGCVTEERSAGRDMERAIQLLSHRGPDASGIKTYRSSRKNILLGSTRLAIIDLSPASNQPMEDTTGMVSIIFNGEIYNYRDLKKQLEKKGHLFKTKSDTEVILEAYKEYGRNFVSKLEGMFALSIYDKKLNLLTLARDHFGKKPFYYYLDEKKIVFGSELKALRAFSSLKLTIDKDAVIKFLMYGYIPSEKSIYNEIKKLAPATLLQIDIDSLRITFKENFWKLNKSKIKKTSFSDAIEQTDLLINKAVEKRLIADVPVGTFLSGGIDSSLITTIASKYHPNIETFSVVYKDKKFDESRYIKLVGNNLRIKYNFFEFRDMDAEEILDEVLDYMDEPMADASILPTTFISKMTAKKVKVALSGDGGDEIFGGYPKYRSQLLVENQFAKLLLFNKKVLYGLVEKMPLNIEKKSIIAKFLQEAKSPLYARHFIWGSGGFTHEELSQRLNNKFIDDSLIFQESKKLSEMFKQTDKRNLMLFLDASIQLPDWYLVKTDRASMSQSLEVRSPLLDKNLVEFAFSLPGSYKFNTWSTKILLRKVAEKYLPKEVITRKKMGFGLPLNKWLQNQFRTRVQESLGYLPDYFNKVYVEKLWTDLLENKCDNGTKIWRLFILGQFLRKYGK